mmetsp:Transcript_124/g.372  ORF Transcript_124/g.372 Transcript_124/m.372 type:complete len:296 (-) Transcript_124:411-1298(-)
MVATSRPRAARSVAMSTSTLRFRKESMMRILSFWSKSPWSATAGFLSSSVNLSSSSSTLCFDCAKTSSWPLASITSTRSDNQPNLSSSSATTSTCCVTVAAACPSVPIVIRTGFCKRSRDIISILGGNVAEKNNVCLEGRMFCAMERICGSKPMFNMRSASSSTKNVHRRKLQPFILTMSISRPGVAITISLPFFISLNCWNLDRPPANVVLRKRKALLNLYASFSICMASSRVGHNTSPIGPSSFCSADWSAQCTNIGIKYATVLPLPVSAIPITSRPHNPAGMACDWIGVGVV